MVSDSGFTSIFLLWKPPRVKLHTLLVKHGADIHHKLSNNNTVKQRITDILN